MKVFNFEKDTLAERVKQLERQYESLNKQMAAQIRLNRIIMDGDEKMTAAIEDLHNTIIASEMRRR